MALAQPGSRLGTGGTPAIQAHPRVSRGGGYQDLETKGLAQGAKSGWQGWDHLLMAEKGVTTKLGFQGLLVAPHKESFSPICLSSHKFIDTDSHYPLCIANTTGP